MTEVNDITLSEQKAMVRVSNKDLICKDCRFRFEDTIKLGNTSVCEKYPLKPNKIFFGKDCKYYSKE